MLEKLSGAAIGRLVNEKYIKPTEVVEYFANRIKTQNFTLHAFTYTRIEEAVSQAEQQEQKIMDGEYVGPFAGVPFALKDFLPSKKGWTNSHGGVPCLHAVDEVDSEFCKAVESLGAIAIGKTNSPAFGFSGCCTNVEYGPTSNPFDCNKNSGGSSGGSGAAVGGGLVPFAEGGDAGGSIRIPAAWCNCFGFKAGVGLIPNVCRPDAWTATHPFCCNGAITKTVEDSLIIFDQMNQYDPRDPFSIPFYKKFKLRDVSGLSVAYTMDFGIFKDIDPEIREAVKYVSDVIFHSLGCGVSPFPPKFDLKYSLDEFTDMWCTAISVDTALDIEQWKTNSPFYAHPDGLDLFKDYANEVPAKFIEYNEKAAKMDIHDFRKFNEMRTTIIDNFEEIFSRYDFILSPVTTCLPIDNKDLDKVDTINFGLTFFANFAGYPALSIPAGLSKSGLPIGVQIIAGKYNEHKLFSLAKALEECMPWIQNYSKSF